MKVVSIVIVMLLSHNGPYLAILLQAHQSSADMHRTHVCAIRRRSGALGNIHPQLGNRYLIFISTDAKLTRTGHAERQQSRSGPVA